jgi:hypothetical protein
MTVLGTENNMVLTALDDAMPSDIVFLGLLYLHLSVVSARQDNHSIAQNRTNVQLCDQGFCHEDSVRNRKARLKLTRSPYIPGLKLLGFTGSSVRMPGQSQ